MVRKIIEPIQIKKRPSHACPRCGGAVHRLHRTALQRVRALFVPAKHYRCSDSACGWEGLLHSRQIAEDRRRFFEENASFLLSRSFWVLALLALAAAVVLGLLAWARR